MHHLKNDEGFKSGAMGTGFAFLERRWGVSSWVGHSVPLAKALTQIAAAGFSCVEIWADRVHLDPRNQAEDVKQIHRVLRDLNLTACSMHLPCTDVILDASDSSVNQSSIDLLKRALESCSYLGGKIAVMHPSSRGSAVDEKTVVRYKRNLGESIQGLLRYAKTLNIQLALENIPNSNGRRFGASMADLKGLIEEIRDPDLGLCLDTGHCLLNGFDLSNEVRECTGHLLTLHASDGDGQGDRHWIPTKGVLNWNQFLTDLRSIDYRGVFLFEVAGQDEENRILKETRAVAESLLKERG